MSEDLYSCNGQVIFRDPTYGIESNRRCEIFVGRIPRNACIREEILPIFKSVGRLLEFRLLVSFGGTSRGFGFAIYATREEAERAIYSLDNYAIRPYWYLGLCWSQNKCKIKMSHIPRNKDFRSIAEFVFMTFDDLKLDDQPLYVVCKLDERDGLTVVWEHNTHRSAALHRKGITGKAAGTLGASTQVVWVEPSEKITAAEYSMMARRIDGRIVITPTDDNLINMYDTPKETLSEVKRSLMTRRNMNLPNLNIPTPVHWANAMSSPRTAPIRSPDHFRDLPSTSYSPPFSAPSGMMLGRTVITGECSNYRQPATLQPRVLESAPGTSFGSLFNLPNSEQMRKSPDELSSLLPRLCISNTDDDSETENCFYDWQNAKIW